MWMGRVWREDGEGGREDEEGKVCENGEGDVRMGRVWCEDGEGEV